MLYGGLDILVDGAMIFHIDQHMLHLRHLQLHHLNGIGLKIHMQIFGNLLMGFILNMKLMLMVYLKIVFMLQIIHYCTVIHLQDMKNLDI